MLEYISLIEVKSGHTQTSGGRGGARQWTIEPVSKGRDKEGGRYGQIPSMAILSGSRIYVRERDAERDPRRRC